MKWRTAGITGIMFLFGFIMLNAQAKQALSIKDAMLLDKDGRHNEAVEALKQIISQSPGTDNKQAYLSLGLVYFRDGDYNNALENFSKSVEANKNNPMAYYFMGMIYEKKALGTPKADQAKEMKTKALQAWQGYLSSVDSTKARPDAHKNIGITVQEGIKRAKKHIEILQEGLRDE